MTDELELERFPVVSSGRPAAFHNTYRDPRGRGTRLHLGADIIAPEGSIIVAPVAGIIRRPHLVDDGNTGYGLSLVERRANGSYLWHFAHLRDAPTLRDGDRVHAGDLLGYVGATGNATWTDRTGVVHRTPHLHLQVERLPSRERVDPTLSLVSVAERDSAPVRYTTEGGAVVAFGGAGSSSRSRPTLERPSRSNALAWGGLAIAALFLLSSPRERRGTWRTHSNS